MRIKKQKLYMNISIKMSKYINIKINIYIYKYIFYFRDLVRNNVDEQIRVLL